MMDKDLEHEYRAKAGALYDKAVARVKEVNADDSRLLLAVTEAYTAGRLLGVMDYGKDAATAEVLDEIAEFHEPIEWKDDDDWGWQ